MADRTAFARARTEDQRAERREAILRTAGEMLRDHRVAELSLNELARRVGLAKSNVLRYFESREAVLLELYDREYRGWLDEIEELAAGEPSEGIDRFAAGLARTAVARPVLCELAGSVPTVLEHNVSGEVAAAYKRAAIANAGRLVTRAERVVGDLAGEAGIALAGGINLALGGIWAMCRPSPGMLAAYRAHPELAALQLDPEIAMREFFATLLTGLRHRAVSADPA